MTGDSLAQFAAQGWDISASAEKDEESNLVGRIDFDDGDGGRVAELVATRFGLRLSFRCHGHGCRVEAVTTATGFAGTLAEVAINLTKENHTC